MKLAAMCLMQVSIGCAIATAAPVVIQISGAVEGEYCDDCAAAFGGFLSVGDQYHATVRFDSANAIVIPVYSFPKSTAYELVGASATLSINGFAFENYVASPMLAFVSNNYPYDIFTIDIPTVPLDAEFRPLAAGPHGVTEIWLGLQDNSATALASTALPTSQSAIWGAQWQRSELVNDINGQCLGRGCANGFTGIASLTVQSLRASVPEPSTCLLALGLMIPFRQRR